MPVFVATTVSTKSAFNALKVGASSISRFPSTFVSRASVGGMKLKHSGSGSHVHNDYGYGNGNEYEIGIENTIAKR